MTETPEPGRLETVARLAAEAALAALPDYGRQLADLQDQFNRQQEQLAAARRTTAEQLQQLTGQPAPLPADALAPLQAQLAEQQAQLAELQAQLAEDRQRYASPERLLANFARQLTDLERKYDHEREARIAADADLREKHAADLKLAVLEREH